MVFLQWKNLLVTSRWSFSSLLRMLSQLGWWKQLLLVTRPPRLDRWSVREESPQNRAFCLVHRKSIPRLADSCMLIDGLDCIVWNFRDTHLFVIVLWGSWGESQDSQSLVAKAQIACAATGLAKLSTAQLCTRAAWFWNELDKIEVHNFTTLSCQFLCFRPHFNPCLEQP